MEMREGIEGLKQLHFSIFQVLNTLCMYEEWEEMPTD